MSIKSVMPSNHLIPCCPLLLLPSIFPSIWVFSNELALHIKWPKYWNFSFSLSPSNEYSGLTSFRTDWFDLLSVQGTLKGLRQHHNSKASIYQKRVLTLADFSQPHTLNIYSGLHFYAKFVYIFTNSHSSPGPEKNVFNHL